MPVARSLVMLVSSTDSSSDEDVMVRAKIRDFSSVFGIRKIYLARKTAVRPGTRTRTRKRGCAV